MPLMENDFDVFGVLFDVRTQGLDSVKGVIHGLVDASEASKKLQGSLVNVNEVLQRVKSGKQAIEWVSQGGDDFARFSYQAQRAAKDVLRVGDEFQALWDKRSKLMAAQETMSASIQGLQPSRNSSPESEEAAALQRARNAARTRLEGTKEAQANELRSVQVHLNAIREQMLKARELTRTAETVGGEPVIKNVARQLRAKSEQVYSFASGEMTDSLRQATSDMARKMSAEQRVLIEQAASFMEQRQEILNRVSQNTFSNRFVGTGGGVTDEYGRQLGAGRRRPAEIDPSAPNARNRDISEVYRSDLQGAASGSGAKGSDARGRDARDPNSFNAEAAALRAQNALDYRAAALNLVRQVVSNNKEAEAIVSTMEQVIKKQAGINPARLPIETLRTQEESKQALKQFEQSMSSGGGQLASVKDRERKYKESLFERQRSQESIAAAEAERYRRAMEFEARTREAQQKIADVVNQGLRQSYMDERKQRYKDRFGIEAPEKMTAGELNELMGRQIKPEHVADPRTPDEARRVEEAETKMKLESPELQALRHQYAAKFSELSRESHEVDQLLRDLPEGHPDREVLDKRRMINQQRRVQLYQDTEDEKRKIQLGPEVFNRVKAIEDLEQQSKVLAQLSKYQKYQKVTYQDFDRPIGEMRADIITRQNPHPETAPEFKAFERKRAADLNKLELDWAQALQSTGHGQVAKGLRNDVAERQSILLAEERAERETERRAAHQARLDRIRGGAQAQVETVEKTSVGAVAPTTVAQAKVNARELLREARNALDLGTAKGPLNFPAPFDEFGNPIPGGRRTPEVISQDPEERLESARLTAREQIRRTMAFRGGQGVDVEPNPFSAPNGPNAAYARMMSAENRLAEVQAKRQQNSSDYEAKINRLAELRVSTTDRIARVEERAAAKRAAFERIESEVAAATTQRIATSREAAEINAQKQLQTQEKLSIGNEKLEAAKRKLEAKDFSGLKGAERTEATRENNSAIERLQREIDLNEELAATSERQHNHKRTLDQQANAEFLADQEKKLNIAEKAMNEEAARATMFKDRQLGRLDRIQEEYTTKERRRNESLLNQEDQASRRVIEARAKYQYDSQRELDRVFSRRSETLEETRMRATMTADGPVANPAFTFARQRQEDVLQELGERTPLNYAAAETSSKAYGKLAQQLNEINNSLDRQHDKVERVRQSELDRLAIYQMHADNAPEEMRGRAQANLAAAQVRAYETVGKAQAKYEEAEHAGINRVTRARLQYAENLRREQASAERALTSANAQSMLNIMLQFGGAIAAVKSFVTETVQYAARTETMRVVTERMSQVNDINTQAIFSQVSAIKSLNITTQEAYGVVQRMIFAELDVAKATQLARVAQDAATISGENSSETLNKIITGITTGQTRILHYMGLQVSMQQVLRQLRTELGREPTEIEKRTAMLNAVLAEGVKISGNYEAAMLTAGKQVLSLKRQFQEAQNAIGNEFQPAYMNIITLMSRFANVARENSSEFATLTRAVAGLAAAFIFLQTVNFVRSSGGEFLSGIASSWALRPAPASPFLGMGGDVLAEGEAAATGGLFGRASAWMKRVPLLSRAAIVASLAVGAGAMYASSTSPMEGVQNTIAATKSQQEMDAQQMRLAYRTGDIDSQSYHEAMGRFFEQDRGLRRKAVAAVSQVWIEQIKKAAEVSQSVEKEIKERGSIGDWSRRLFAEITWPFADNKYKTAGYTWLETLTGSQSGNVGFGRVGKSADEDFKNLQNKLREKAREEGDVVTAVGVVTVKDKIKQIDEFIAGLKAAREHTNDPLYNVRLMLQQETQNLDDIIQKKTDATKVKVSSIVDSILDKIVLDPVEKIRQKMIAEIDQHDVSTKPEVKAAISHLKSLGMGIGTSNPQYDEFKRLSDRQEALGLSSDQLLAYQKAMSGRVGDTNLIESGDTQTTRGSQIRRYGLAGLEPKLDEYDRISRRLKELTEGTSAVIENGKIVKESTRGNPDLALRLSTERSLENNDEQLKKIRKVFDFQREQEARVRTQKYQTRDTEFDINIAQLRATPGIVGERASVESTFQTKTQLEVAQHQQRNVEIRKAVALMRELGEIATDSLAAQRLTQLLDAEKVTSNEKLVDLDHQRLLAQEQINQRVRQQNMDVDVGRAEDQLRLREAVLKAQMAGENQRLPLAEKLRDLAIQEADAKFRIKNPGQTDSSNDAETIRAKDAANLTFELEKLAIAESKVDKARSAAQSLIEFNFKKEEALLKARAFGPLAEMSAERQAFDLKKKQIEALAEFQRNADGEKKNAAEIDAQRDRELRDAELEFLTKRMEMAKKVREDNQKLGGDIFNAIWGRAHGQTNAFKDLTDNFIKNTGETVFKNLWNIGLNGPHGALGKISDKFTLPGQGTIDHPTFLGKLFQGTRFGLKDHPEADVDKYVRSHSMVADSNVALITAMERLRQAIMDRDAALRAAGDQAGRMTMNPRSYDYGFSVGKAGGTVETPSSTESPRVSEEPSKQSEPEQSPQISDTLKKKSSYFSQLPRPFSFAVNRTLNDLDTFGNSMGVQLLGAGGAEPDHPAKNLAWGTLATGPGYTPDLTRGLRWDTLAGTGLREEDEPPTAIRDQTAYFLYLKNLMGVPRAPQLDDRLHWDASATKNVDDYDQVMKGDSSANWQQNTRLPAGGSYTSANLRSWVGLMPDAYSKVGHVPLFTYKDPNAAEAGEYGWGDKGIRLNTAKIQDGTEGSILRHELTHKLMEPAIPAMTQDKQLQGYFDRIRSGLVAEHGSMYAGQGGKPLPAQNVVTEALAYDVQNGKIPGLTPAEGRAFTERAMMVARENKQKDLVDLYDKLKGPEAGEFTMKAAPADQKVHYREYDAQDAESGSLAKVDVQDKIRAAAVAQGVDPAQVLGLAKSESGFDQSQTSKTGARGVFQFTKGTAKSLGIDREDVDQNVEGGVRYWKQLITKYDGNVDKALAEYKGVSVGGATMADVARTRKLMASFEEETSSGIPDSSRPAESIDSDESIESAAKRNRVGDLEYWGLNTRTPGATQITPWAIPADNTAGHPAYENPVVLPPQTARPSSDLGASAALAAQATHAKSGTPAGDVLATVGAAGSVAQMLGKPLGGGEVAADAKVAQNALALSQSGSSGGYVGAVSQGANVLGTVVGGLKKNEIAKYQQLTKQMETSALSDKDYKSLIKLRKKLGISGADSAAASTPSSVSSEIGPEGVPETTSTRPPGGESEEPGTGSGEASKSGGAAGAVGTGMEVAAGAFMAYDAFKQFGKGGARGALGGAQDLLGIASMIPGPQQPFIMAGAMAVGLIKSLLGDPRAKYKKEIEKRLKQAKYNEPDTIQETLNTSGQRVDFDFMNRVREGGMIQSGPLSTLTDVEYQNLLKANQGQRYSASPMPSNLGLLGGIRYSDLAPNTNASGGNTAAPGNPVSLAINVNTMDSRSFNDNSNKIADAMRQQLLLNHPISNDIRQIAGA